MTYSMTGEDDIVLKYFGDFKGRFLDLGAHDGKEISNTYLLAEHGWSGVAVEACFEFIGKWRENMGGFPAVELLNAAIAPASGITPFWYLKGSCESSASEALVKTCNVRVNAKLMHVASVTVAELIAYFKPPFHFINIDIDGNSLDAMKALDLDAVGCRCICVEYLHEDHVPVREDKIIVPYLEERGFRILEVNQENVIAVRG